MVARQRRQSHVGLEAQQREQLSVSNLLGLHLKVSQGAGGKCEVWGGTVYFCVWSCLPHLESHREIDRIYLEARYRGVLEAWKARSVLSKCLQLAVLWPHKRPWIAYRPKHQRPPSLPSHGPCIAGVCRTMRAKTRRRRTLTTRACPRPLPPTGAWLPRLLGVRHHLSPSLNTGTTPRHILLTDV